eukprot:542588-Lingulodinium_polyedra.AAC.1
MGRRLEEVEVALTAPRRVPETPPEAPMVRAASTRAARRLDHVGAIDGHAGRAPESMGQPDQGPELRPRH